MWELILKYLKFIDSKHNLILMSAHPSPLSAYRGFFGSKHFSKCNKYLEKHNLDKIIYYTDQEAGLAVTAAWILPGWLVVSVENSSLFILEVIPGEKLGVVPPIVYP